LLVWLLSVQAGSAAESLVLHYVSIAGDPLYTEQRAYTGVELRTRHPPREGARTALKESRIPGRAAGLVFEMADIEAAHPDDAAARILAASEQDAEVFLLDLPAPAIRAAAAMAGRRDVVLLNLQAPEDDLRELCNPALLHVAPSRSMLIDALAQYLNKMSWRRVLVLVGETAEDAVVAAAFRASAEKFGIDVAAERPFRADQRSAAAGPHQPRVPDGRGRLRRAGHRGHGR
jgi:ABC transporter substrate binding protein (PQQ-dependent alcohol dehydrogenase system)